MPSHRNLSIACALAALLWAGCSFADPFFFSTGNPDGKIATASRPGPAVGVNQETESADDFVLPHDTLLTSATFTGLVPIGVSVPTDVAQIVVEIYRVFPQDSNVGRTNGPPLFSTSQVPARMNSPSDVEFDDRDSSAGNLGFTTINLGTFAVTNSVDTGIHPLPGVFTGGDGPVTGQEVVFSVTFTEPFDLPFGHYFFVPQVLLSNPDDHFLWLSAPKPIVPPGTPFPPGATDLQSWIRNAELDPDWLRVGTDITHQGPFNATFSLVGFTPEPGSLVLAGAGLLALGLLYRRKRSSE